MKILVFGNILVAKDSLALKLVPKLAKEFSEIEFKECDGAESIESEGRNLLILDVAIGIAKVSLIDGLDVLEVTHPYSMHDFDLSLTLRILKKINAIDSVRIIAIPSEYSEKKALVEVRKIISTLLLENV